MINKERMKIELKQEIYNRTCSMFEWINLPETVDKTCTELLLQKNGHIFFFKHAGEIYALSGSLGGKQDVYGRPSEIVISNPFLELTKSFKLTEGVIIYNDAMGVGLEPFLNRNIAELIETNVSINMWNINNRIQKVFTGATEKTLKSAELFISNIEQGQLKAVADESLVDGLKEIGSAQSGLVNVQQLIELKQYIKSEIFNEVGLPSNFNMKRERLISSELDNAEDSLFSYTYNMMEQRLKGVEKVNEFFGLELSVDFGSVWALKHKELVDDEKIDPLIGGNGDTLDSEEEVNPEEDQLEDQLEDQPEAEPVEAEEEPEEAEPEEGEPEEDQPEGDEPEGDQPEGDDPEADQPEESEPEDDDSEEDEKK